MDTQRDVGMTICRQNRCLVRVRAFFTDQHLAHWLLLLAILLGAWFRFTGVNWDENQHLHPDERFLTMVETSISLPKSLGEYFDSANSPLNPFNRGHTTFVYGTFPVFLVRVIGEMVGQTGYDEITIVGRLLSGLFDLATVYVIYLIGRRLYGSWVGAVGALLAAATAFNIQQSHFFTVDTFATTLIAVALYYAVRISEGSGVGDFIALGIAYGLAVASKINLAVFVAIIGLACVVRIYRQWQKGPEPSVRPRPLLEWKRTLVGYDISLRLEAPNSPTRTTEERTLISLVTPALWWAIFAGIIAVLVFRVAQPYAFQGPGFFNFKFSKMWLDNMSYVSKLVSGQIDYPPSHQWTGRTPYLYPLQNMLLWGLGLPLGLAAWAGVVIAAWQIYKERNLAHLLPVSWISLFFLYQGGQFVKSLRYLVPIYPFLALMAGWLVVWCWQRALAWYRKGGWRRYLPIAALALALVVVGGSILWAYAVTRIYTRPVTRIAASRWIYENIPPGSHIANEHWDDGLPLRIDGKDGFGAGWYVGHEIQGYAEDEPAKLVQLVDTLDATDYIMITSTRLYKSIPRLPMRYPMMTRYYEKLFAGELGFELIKTFTSYPNLGPIQFNDDEAEEVWTVYDHPKVLIFKKTSDYSHTRVYQILSEGIQWDEIKRLWPIQAGSWKNGLVYDERTWEVQKTGGTWSSIFNRNSLSNKWPVLFWLLAVEVIGLLSLPLTYAFLRHMADRGYIFAKSLGILSLTWVTWMLVNFTPLTYEQWTILLALCLLAGTGGYLLWRRGDEIRAWLRVNRRTLLIEEGLFLLFFVAFLLVRWGNPDLWHPVMGGEKPMDFAYLNAVIKSTEFPPYDPWYAGGYLNYYYFGQIITATLVKLTGIVPWVSYNLALPLYFALLAMGAFTVAYNLVASQRASVDDQQDRTALFCGLAGALFVAVLGNLSEAGLIATGFQSFSAIGEVKSAIPGLSGLIRTLNGLWHWIRQPQPFPFRPEWPYWNASRVMPHGEINEFPYFTFLYADLHAHLMSLPFTVMVLGMAVNLVREVRLGAATARSGVGRTIAGWRAWLQALTHRVDWTEGLELLVLAFAVGALRCINTWDWPTYLLVTALALGIREYERRGRVDLDGLVAWIVRAGVVAVLSIALYYPFWRYYATGYTAIELWEHERTALSDYLTIHGLFLFVIGSFVFWSVFGQRRSGGSIRMLRLSVRFWDRIPRLWSLYDVLVVRGREWLVPSALAYGVLVLALLLAMRAGMWLYLVILPLGALFVALILRARADPRQRLMWVLGALALALTVAVEWVVLRGDIGRMNTVFKFYLQVWVLWGIVAAAALDTLVRASSRWSQEVRTVWWCIFTVLFICAALYPLYATQAKIRDRFDPRLGPGLDGMAYMTTSRYYDENRELELKWDYEAIQWMLDHIQGSPVILEANTPLYRWGSRVSIYTGLPATVGWDWHQAQQRSVMPREVVDHRVAEVRETYTNPNVQETMRLLQKYDVSYIYMGELEEAYYGTAATDKFEYMRSMGLLELVYHNERVRIYRVL